MVTKGERKKEMNDIILFIYALCITTKVKHNADRQRIKSKQMKSNKGNINHIRAIYKMSTWSTDRKISIGKNEIQFYCIFVCVCLFPYCIYILQCKNSNKQRHPLLYTFLSVNATRTPSFISPNQNWITKSFQAKTALNPAPLTTLLVLCVWAQTELQQNFLFRRKLPSRPQWWKEYN